MSKRVGGIKRLQIQNLFMAFKQVPSYHIVEFENEIDYGLKALQDWQPQFFPIVAFVYSNHFYGRTEYISETYYFSNIRRICIQ